MRKYRVKRVNLDNHYWWAIQASTLNQLQRESWVPVCTMEGKLRVYSMRTDALNIASALQERQGE